MKVSIITAILITLISCKGKTYHFTVTYTDGTVERLNVYCANSQTRPVLKDGCLKWYNSESSIVCGVRNYTFYTD